MSQGLSGPPGPVDADASVDVADASRGATRASSRPRARTLPARDHDHARGRLEDTESRVVAPLSPGAAELLCGRDEDHDTPVHPAEESRNSSGPPPANADAPVPDVAEHAPPVDAPEDETAAEIAALLEWVRREERVVGRNGSSGGDLPKNESVGDDPPGAKGGRVGRMDTVLAQIDALAEEVGAVPLPTPTDSEGAESDDEDPPRPPAGEVVRRPPPPGDEEDPDGEEKEPSPVRRREDLVETAARGADARSDGRANSDSSSDEEWKSEIGASLGAQTGRLSSSSDHQALLPDDDQIERDLFALGHADVGLLHQCDAGASGTPDIVVGVPYWRPRKTPFDLVSELAAVSVLHRPKLQNARAVGASVSFSLRLTRDEASTTGVRVVHDRRQNSSTKEFRFVVRIVGSEYPSSRDSVSLRSADVPTASNTLARMIRDPAWRQVVGTKKTHYFAALVNVLCGALESNTQVCESLAVSSDNFETFWNSDSGATPLTSSANGLEARSEDEESGGGAGEGDTGRAGTGDMAKLRALNAKVEDFIFGGGDFDLSAVSLEDLKAALMAGSQAALGSRGSDAGTEDRYVPYVSKRDGEAAQVRG